MPDAPDVQSLLRAAEEAAAGGDSASAERLLRQVAALQEASLGSLHPDLATTLNNLGIVCEMADNPVDAEHYFRRACVIAATVLEADHPFVATSRRNLEAFCAARGKPLKLPEAGATPVLALGAADDAPAAVLLEPLPEPRTMSEPARVDVRGSRGRRVGAAAALAAGLLLTLAVVTWLRSDREEPHAADAAVPGPQAVAESLPIERPGVLAAAIPSAPPSEAPEPIHPVAGDAMGAVQQGSAASTAGQAGGADERRAPSSGPAPIVVAAELCRSLATGREWQCVPPGRPLEPGPLVFYTRLKSPAPVTVQHRWYRGDHLHRVVDLAIRANMIDGYRTYSRHTVAAAGPGDWRVELSTAGGTVLHAERFVVR